ncbi:hypothetical protein RFI_06905 [Reticulomyxa filosa]|uniref:Protein kinase domain-containing protein n=1 Tax=Reticulomyxa filosa TaxID=46433 RepID=X6NW41_RETFI|nr:hypothetical protein RFI_06905 [Reticulomyxa filosa]|eukprot:ETO30216.1 hypothetical protein RFI_06905 [Reticulomyxa filosa]
MCKHIQQKDIKPDNVLVFVDLSTRRLHCKISDFGFATRVNVYTASGVQLLQQLPPNTLAELKKGANDRAGSPGYWAPELCNTCVELTQSFKLDVFSADNNKKNYTFMYLLLLLLLYLFIYLFILGSITFFMLTPFISYMLCNELPFDAFESWPFSNVTKTKLLKAKPWFIVVQWVNTDRPFDSSLNGGADKQKASYIRRVCNRTLSEHSIDLMRNMLKIRSKDRFTLRQSFSFICFLVCLLFVVCAGMYGFGKEQTFFSLFVALKIVWHLFVFGVMYIHVFFHSAIAV